MIQETLLYTCDRCKATATAQGDEDSKVKPPAGWGEAMGGNFCPTCLPGAQALEKSVWTDREKLESSVLQRMNAFTDPTTEALDPPAEEYDWVRELGRLVLEAVGPGVDSTDISNQISYLCGPDGYSMSYASLPIRILMAAAKGIKPRDVARKMVA